MSFSHSIQSVKDSKEKEKDDTTADFEVEPMQPLDKLASYEFLQRLGRSSGNATPNTSRFNDPQSPYRSPLNR